MGVFRELSRLAWEERRKVAEQREMLRAAGVSQAGANYPPEKKAESTTSLLPDSEQTKGETIIMPCAQEQNQSSQGSCGIEHNLSGLRIFDFTGRGRADRFRATALPEMRGGFCGEEISRIASI